MKKFTLPLLGVALLLASCGGGSTPTNSTLYRGVWGWGIFDPTTEQLIERGAVIYDGEVQFEGRTLASGDYANEANTRRGYSVLGPINAAGHLETAFSVEATQDSAAYFAGRDQDDALQPVEGKPTFQGDGAIYNSSNQATQNVVVILVQTSTTVPTSLTTQNQAKDDARAFVGRLAGRVNLQKTGAGFQPGVFPQNFSKFFQQR